MNSKLKTWILIIFTLELLKKKTESLLLREHIVIILFLFGIESKWKLLIFLDRFNPKPKIRNWKTSRQTKLLYFFYMLIFSWHTDVWPMIAALRIGSIFCSLWNLISYISMFVLTLWDICLYFSLNRICIWSHEYRNI